jgi:hypothetical protein
MLFAASISMLVLAIPVAGARSRAQQTWIVFRCGERYANLCGLVPETGESRQLTSDGDPSRPGSPSYVRFQRAYHGASLSPDGKLLSFAFDGGAYIARQDAEARLRVGESGKVGFTSLSPNRRRLVLINRLWKCIGGPNTGVCRGHGTLIISTIRGHALRRIPGVWHADWAGGRLVASRFSDQVLLISGPTFRKERVLIERQPWSLSDPVVSPDGRLVASAVATQNRGFIAIFSMSSHEVVRRLTFGVADWQPAWSPDGKKIVFSRSTQPCPGPDPCTDLYVVRTDGRGQPRSLGVRGIEPTWGLRVE